jgi:hypothetical protein
LTCWRNLPHTRTVQPGRLVSYQETRTTT